MTTMGMQYRGLEQPHGYTISTLGNVVRLIKGATKVKLQLT